MPFGSTTFSGLSTAVSDIGAGISAEGAACARLGLVELAILSCSVHLARIDLSLEPAPTPQMAPHSVAMIEDTAELQKQLLQIIDAIGKGIVLDWMARVAVYLHFLTIADDFVEANKTITNVVPKKYGVKITDEEDFVFQINQRQTSKQVPGIKLNVLKKWSVERIQVFTLSMPAPGVPSPSPLQLPRKMLRYLSHQLWCSTIARQQNRYLPSIPLNSLLFLWTPFL